MSFFDVFPTFAEAPYSYVLVPVILVCSIIGFYSKRFFHRHLLHPYEVWRGKRWYTLVTSALVHRNWLHLLNNALIIYGLGYDMFGNIEQEKGVFYAYLITPVLFLVLIVIPNLIQTAVKRNNFPFTAVGASGLSFGLYGFSALYFPLQPMKNIIIPSVENMLHNWLIAAAVLLLLTTVRKGKLINVRLHLSAYLIGSALAIMVRTESYREIFF